MCAMVALRRDKRCTHTAAANEAMSGRNRDGMNGMGDNMSEVVDRLDSAMLILMRFQPHLVPTIKLCVAGASVPGGGSLEVVGGSVTSDVQSSPRSMVNGSPTLYGNFLAGGGTRTPTERPTVVRGDPLRGDDCKQHWNRLFERQKLV